NCAAQQNGTFVEMLGNIQVVRGDFIVKTTNGGVLRMTLDKTALTTITIGGDLVIEGNSEVWFCRSGNTVVNVAGDFAFRSTSTASSYLTTTGTGQLNVAGSMTMNSSAILRFASSGGGEGTLRVKKDFDLQAGTITLLPVGSGTLIMNGQDAQRFKNTGNLATDINVEIHNPQGVIFDPAVAVDGNILVKAGSHVTLPAENLSLQGNLEIEAGGSINANGGVLRLTGPLDQTLILQGDTLFAVQINKPAGTAVHLNTSAKLSGSLVIETSGVTLQTNHNLTLLSGNDDGTDDAYIGAIPAGSFITGNVMVQRYMEGEGRIYRYISSPVSSATVADLQDDFPVTGTFDNPSTGPGIASQSPSFFQYDEVSTGANGWVNYPAGGSAADNSLSPGRGYAAFIRAADKPTVWDVSGDLNQHDINFNLTFTDTNDPLNDGWNLIGNPYASAIAWGKSQGWSSFNVINSIAVRDNGQGIFLYWDGEIGSLTNGRIAKGQAFWVKTNGPNPSLTIHESAKVNESAPFHRTGVSNPDFLEVTVTKDNLSDKTFLRLHHDASAYHDRFDIPKWTNDFLNVSFLADAMPLAIMATSQVPCEKNIPLQLYFATTAAGSLVKSPAGEYSLSVAAFGVFSGSQIRLNDNYLRQSFDFLNGTYRFLITDDPMSYSKERFSIQINADSLNNRITVTMDSLWCSTSQPHAIKLDNLEDNVRYEVWVGTTKAADYLNRDARQYEFNIQNSVFMPGENIVRVVARNECYSQTVKQVPVVDEEKMSPLVIQEKGDLLISSYENGNRWSLDGKLLEGETSQWIQPHIQGIYSAEVVVNGCSTSGSFPYILQEKDFKLYPNPASTFVTMTAPRDESIFNINLYTLTGLAVKSVNFSAAAKQGTVNVSDLPPGPYLVEVQTEKQKRRMKFVKSE
ncbi:MAG TPA: T9SS type A sorting domain-containing protein, partial [Ohtaekwangia sp.]|nr:T9SS type A sorting domain-containing protein [Ohtaekwangia sp.]